MKTQIERIIKDLAYDNFKTYADMYPTFEGKATEEATSNVKQLASNYYDNRTNEDIDRDEQYNVAEEDYQKWCLEAFKNHIN